MIKGFNNSIGWNLGKKLRSIHLFDPLTSTPISGTNIKKIKDIKKNTRDNFKSFFWSINEKKKIHIIAKIMNIKCLKKNR